MAWHKKLINLQKKIFEKAVLCKKGTCTCHRYCGFINFSVNTNIVDFFADLIRIHAHAHTFKIAISNNVLYG